MSNAIDFSKYESAKGGAGLTAPGTIAVFKLKEVEVFAEPGKTPRYQVTFEESDGGPSFKHSFFITDKAIPRFRYLMEKALQSEDLGNMEEAQIITGLTGKELGLKVSGEISKDGKGFPTLSFGGFASSPAEVGTLKLTRKEEGDVQAALEAQRNNSNGSASADQPAAASASLESDGDEF